MKFMYVEAVGTLPPSGMSMLSVQMIPPLGGTTQWSFGLTRLAMSPDHAIVAARSPRARGSP